jgi:hypothetical protein
LYQARFFMKYCEYDAVHFALPVVFSLSNQKYTRYRINHEIKNIILHHVLKYLLKEIFNFEENNDLYEMIRRS